MLTFHLRIIGIGFLEDEYEGEWIQQIYDALPKREQGHPTRLLHEENMSDVALNKVQGLLKLGPADTVSGGKHHNFRDFFNFYNPLKNPDLNYKPFPPIIHKDFQNTVSIFRLIRKSDRLLHYPYHSFGHLENFLEQSAIDKKGLLLIINISLNKLKNKTTSWP
ncbi:hypothetical protein [Flavivirga sp. 57AJ16]|uniref:hypothetical protein n=1 Tax=Flavivirga sp. 57AJ16 TaxID=3025307 RepID=UPI0023656A6E|nr:hypothetical protein [Flavivirga sp. 57AJ16]MDD7885369.1 hypothetical protein [Flavivirga sp. 57AJ16]